MVDHSTSVSPSAPPKPLSNGQLTNLAINGGLRKKTRGEKQTFHLSRAQLGLMRRIVGGDEEKSRKLVIAAMEMGTGKTLAALASLCVLRARAKGERAIKALFVVPKSTLYNTWRTQLRKFTRLEVDDIRVVTYPRLQRAFISCWQKRPDGTWKKIRGHPLLDSKKDLVVFDESHVLRNPKTILAKASSIVSETSERVVCLTGTPVHNGPEDASGQLRAMSSRSSLENPMHFGNRVYLRKKAVKSFSERFIYSATLQEAGIMLEPKISQTVWIDQELSREMIQRYNKSLSLVKGTAVRTKRNDTEIKHHMLILRQLCVEPALFHKFGRQNYDQETIKLTAQHPGPKLRRALACVRRLVFEGHSKIVVVSEFVSLLDTFKFMAEEHLGEVCMSFDGRLTAAARGKTIEQFLHSDSRILCLSLGAGAYGLNLTPGPTAMVIMDVWFNPAVHRQVEARIHRLGQTKKTLVLTLVMRNSVEEAILNTHRDKELCASNIISGVVDNVIQTSEAKRIAWKCEDLKHQASPSA